MADPDTRGREDSRRVQGNACEMGSKKSARDLEPGCLSMFAAWNDRGWLVAADLASGAVRGGGA